MNDSKVDEQKRKPAGELTIRTLAMPANTNPNGDIFGGWIVSTMDLAGLVLAKKITQHRIVTVAIDKMEFIAPVKVGDTVCCYGKITHEGNTSFQIKLETWALGYADGGEKSHIVTEGLFTYVAIDENNKPVPVRT